MKNEIIFAMAIFIPSFLQANLEQIMLDNLFDSANDLSDFGQIACKVILLQGFYVPDPMAIVISDKSCQPCCHLLCHRTPGCVSGNYFHLSDLGLCTLHESTLMPGDIIDDEFSSRSVYFDFDCSQKPKRKRRFVNSGGPPSHCGTPSWDIWNFSRPIGFNRPRRFSGAFAATPYSQPWLGYLFVADTLKCSASLIVRNPTDRSTKWALTAAHCVYKKWSFRQPKYLVAFGNPDRLWSSPHFQLARVAKIRLHPEFSHLLQENDIALLEFEEVIQFNQYVSAICLPDSEVDYDLALLNAVCHVCGWGTESEEESNGKLGCLKPLVERESSIKSLKTTDWTKTLASRWPQTDGKSSNGGDSGGATVCRLKQQVYYTILGVISTKYGSNNQAVALYVYVPKYLLWIRSKIENNPTS